MKHLGRFVYAITEVDDVRTYDCVEGGVVNLGSFVDV